MTKGPSRFPCSVVAFVRGSCRTGACAGRRSYRSGAGHLLDGKSAGSGAGRTAPHGAPGPLRAREAGPRGKSPGDGRTASRRPWPPSGAWGALRAQGAKGKIAGARTVARGAGGSRVSGPAGKAAAGELADRDAGRASAGTVTVRGKQRRERRASYVAGMPIAGMNRQQEQQHALVLTFTAGADSMAEMKRGQALHGLPTRLSGGQVSYDLLTHFSGGQVSYDLLTRFVDGQVPYDPLTPLGGGRIPYDPHTQSGQVPYDLPIRSLVGTRAASPFLRDAAKPLRKHAWWLGWTGPLAPPVGVFSVRPTRTGTSPAADHAGLSSLPRRRLPGDGSWRNPAGPCLMRDRSRTMTARSRQSKKCYLRFFHDRHSRSKSEFGGACAASLPGRESGDPLMDCAVHPLRLLIRPPSGTSRAAPSSAENDAPSAEFAEKSLSGHSLSGPAPPDRWPVHRKGRRNPNHKEQGK